MNRRTVAGVVRVPAEGFAPGLFTRCDGAVEIRPAGFGEGVRLRAADGPAFAPGIDRLDTRPAHPALAVHGARHTCLAASEQAEPVRTVEHLLGALLGLGISDAEVVIRTRAAGPLEVPIFDGSARAFVEAVALVGLVESTEGALWVPVPWVIEVARGGARVRIEPRPVEEASFTYQFEHPRLGAKRRQVATWRAGTGNAEGAFAREVAPARTFSFEDEARAAHGAGLFTRFGPRDLLVLGEDGPIENTLRFPDEPARHKLLDLIGDLALASHGLPGKWRGARLAAAVTGVKSGHALHHEAARAVVEAVARAVAGAAGGRLGE